MPSHSALSHSDRLSNPIRVFYGIQILSHSTTNRKFICFSLLLSSHFNKCTHNVYLLHMAQNLTPNRQIELFRSLFREKFVFPSLNSRSRCSMEKNCLLFSVIEAWMRLEKFSRTFVIHSTRKWVGSSDENIEVIVPKIFFLAKTFSFILNQQIHR